MIPPRPIARSLQLLNFLPSNAPETIVFRRVARCTRAMARVPESAISRSPRASSTIPFEPASRTPAGIGPARPEGFRNGLAPSPARQRYAIFAGTSEKSR